MNELGKDNQAKLQPQLRFKGFTQPWEQRQVKDILSYERPDRILTPDTLIKEQGKYPVLTANKAFVLGYTDDSQKVQNDIPRIVFDDFTMDSKFADFPFSVRSSAIKLLSPRYKDNLYFLYLLINTLHFPELGHARHYISYVQSRRIRIPSTSEQSAIANFFHVLDSLISAAKRQRDLLQLKRQAYLQQIFPRDSEQRPQLRFSGFNDDWKPIQLRSIINRIRRQNTNNETQHILTISAQDGLIDQNTYFGRRIASKDDSNYLLIKQGEFAYNKSYSRDFPMGAIKRLKRYSEGALSPLYIAFSVHNVVPEFMEALFDSGVWHSEVMRLATEGARNHGLLNISPNDFFSMRLMIPENMKEQQYIAKFFQVLNSLVSAAEHKVNTLYELKQGYMQKMFI